MGIWRNRKTNNFVDFPKNSFGLQLKTNPKISITRNENCIDILVFAKYLKKVDRTKYICYFNYHKPLLRIIIYRILLLYYYIKTYNIYNKCVIKIILNIVIIIIYIYVIFNVKTYSTDIVFMKTG